LSRFDPTVLDGQGLNRSNCPLLISCQQASSHSSLPPHRRPHNENLGLPHTMNTQEHIYCAPTWQGRIETTRDALIVFEACLCGYLQHCLRRPTEAELPQLIASGNVFVYEEATSGIKRWTDGKWWSPSRTLANFLLYRQLSSSRSREEEG
jgi:hypothetical protein